MNLQQMRNYDLIMEMKESGDFSKASEINRMTLPAVMFHLQEELSEDDLTNLVTNLNAGLAEGMSDSNRYSIIRCKSCGKYFTLATKEAKSFTEKGLDVPVKCNTCRYKKKTNLTETKDIDMKTFMLKFVDGASRKVHGKTVAEACKQAGIPISRLNQLDNWSEIG